MALRWKREERWTGLRAITQGDRGYQLRNNGQKIATVSCFKGSESNGWYWVARCDELGIPLYNSCQENPKTLQEAKDEAMLYCKMHMKKDT